MTIDEIIQVVKANAGNSVIMKFTSGEVLVAEVLTVDAEGFVYDPDPPETRKTNTLYWNAFSEFNEVHPKIS